MPPTSDAEIPHPDFADDLDRANHALLVAAGYRWSPHNLEPSLPGDKTLYAKRCHQYEASGEGADRCCLHLYRYDMRPYRKAYAEPVSYQAEVCLETPERFAVRADLYGFGAARLATLARREARENSGVMRIRD